MLWSEFYFWSIKLTTCTRQNMYKKQWLFYCYSVSCRSYCIKTCFYRKSVFLAKLSIHYIIICLPTDIFVLHFTTSSWRVYNGYFRRHATISFFTGCKKCFQWLLRHCLSCYFEELRPRPCYFSRAEALIKFPLFSRGNSRMLLHCE